jgi:5-formyltetrahydrofolate cyclo-ligase
MEIQEEKQKLREKIWRILEEKKIARFPLPCHGRIPNFEDSEKAAELVTTLPEWKRAKIVFSNPDAAQQPVRELALKEGKILIMATPKLKKGYLKIDPKDVKGKEKKASTIKGAFKYGKPLKGLPKPDLIITGCVAVSKNNFYRLGKGSAYGDREIKFLYKKFGPSPVVTTVHEIQVVDEIPYEKHDTQVDIIVTPLRIIKRANLSSTS